MIKISVIVPVYNSEKYLKRCVDSILKQTYQNLELILVDDGSPDDSPKICDDYALQDSRVKVIHQSNSGVAVARNTGIDLASGDYFTFVDSDDYIDSRMYEFMVNIASKYNCDIVMCDCIKEFYDHDEIYSHDIRPGFYNYDQLKEEYYPHLLIMPNVEYPPTISNGLCLFKNKKSKTYYEAGIRYSEDLLFGAQMMYQAKSFYYMKNKTFYHYNCTNQLSATHTFKSDKWNDYMRLHTCINKHFKCCKDYDFSEQIDKLLLFFVYNAVGELLRTTNFNRRRKIEMAKEILNEPEVKAMFQRLKIWKLPISIKQKIWTAFYKARCGIAFLCLYTEAKMR